MPHTLKLPEHCDIAGIKALYGELVQFPPGTDLVIDASCTQRITTPGLQLLISCLNTFPHVIFKGFSQNMIETIALLGATHLISCKEAS